MPPLPPLQWVGPVPPPVTTLPAVIETRQTRQDVPRSRRPRAAGEGREPEEAASIQRNLAVGKWKVVLHAAAHCCNRHLVDPSLDSEERQRSLKDVLREKAPATLNKRAGSILLYLRWGRARGYTDGELLPFREEIAYSYARDLADDEAPPTRASSFIEAALLATELLSMKSDDLLRSARLKGAIYGSFERKRLTVKKDGLSANVVWALEALVVNEEAPITDRIFAGFAVWCALTRQRVGDAVRVMTEPFLDPSDVPPAEADFIETTAGKTKAGNVKRRRRLQLPIVCSARGLSGVPWAAKWLDLRRMIGMEAGTDRTMMRAPKAGDCWAKRQLTTDEFGDWLRMLSREAVPSEEGLKDYGAHSCKITVLSWAAKAGMPKPPRRILGGHAKAGDKTVAEYSRDELAEPLRLVELLFVWIRAGEFVPEANRSGRWSAGRQGPTWYPTATLADKERHEERAKALAKEKEEDGAGDGRESEASSSQAPESEAESGGTVPTVVPSDSSDGDEPNDAVADEDRKEEEEVAVAAEAPPVLVSGEREYVEESLRALPMGGLFQHDPDDRGKARLTLHCGDPDNEDKLRCNRAVMSMGGIVYKQLFAWPLFSGGECRQCMPAEEREVMQKELDVIVSTLND